MVELSGLVKEKRKTQSATKSPTRKAPPLRQPPLSQTQPYTPQPPSHMYPNYAHAPYPGIPSIPGMGRTYVNGTLSFPGGGVASSLHPSHMSCYPQHHQSNAQSPAFHSFYDGPNIAAGHNGGSIPPSLFNGGSNATTTFPSIDGLKGSTAVSLAGGSNAALASEVAAFMGSRNPLKRPRTDNAAIFVKSESSIGDPDATPRDVHEKLVCGQLQQNYGFTDVREMLTSYRRLKDATVPSVEDVMIDIVSLREEADETKKMDEARRQSEKTRKEEAKRRRLAIQEERKLELESATVDAFRSTHFPNSWILQGTAGPRIENAVTRTSTALKRSLISLLELEQKTRKWYGPTLPRSYFRRILSATLTTCESLADTLDDRVKYLQTIMFQLSEQTQSGVPLVFRDAYDADNSLDDDDEVEIQIVATPNTSTTPKTPTPKQPEAKEVVVIDLLT